MFIILSPTRDSNPEELGLLGNPLAPAIRRRNSAAAILTDRRQPFYSKLKTNRERLRT